MVIQFRQLTPAQRIIYARGCVELKQLRQNGLSPIAELEIWSQIIKEVIAADDPKAANQFAHLPMEQKHKMVEGGVLAFSYFSEISSHLRP